MSNWATKLATADKLLKEKKEANYRDTRNQTRNWLKKTLGLDIWDRDIKPSNDEVLWLDGDYEFPGLLGFLWLSDSDELNITVEYQGQYDEETIDLEDYEEEPLEILNEVREVVMDLFNGLGYVPPLSADTATNSDKE